MKDIETYKPYFQHKPDCAQRTVAPDPAWQAHIEMNNVCTCGRDQALAALAAHLSTSNGMTEEEIERISDEQETIAQMAFDPEDITAYTVGFKSGLRYARDRGMLAPSNVPVVTHLNMDPNASTETKEAVRDMIQAAYSYKPQREHAWEARGMNGHWWCLNCGICGGNSTAPANIGPCVDKGPANTCASPPLNDN